MSRYSRQELFVPIGPGGQARLRAARVLVVGCGALGSALAETLARAGVGRLTLVDRDVVEASNLQRQSLFDEEDAARARPKAIAAVTRLKAINSEVDVEGRVADLDAALATELVRESDLVLDGLDNFEARYVLNDVCLQAGVPWVYGACVAAHGAVLAVRPGQTPCLRCVVGEKPSPGTGDTCDTVGVVAPVVQVVAGLQGAEALKLLTGDTASLLPGLATLDLWAGTFDVTDLRGRAPWCPSCAEARYDYATAAPPASSVLCGRDAVQLPASGTVDLPSLADRLRPAGQVMENEHLVRFLSSEAELVVFADGRAIVKGVADTAGARSIYARYVGA